MNQTPPPRADSPPVDSAAAPRAPSWPWWALAGGLVLLAALKGLRFPGLWPITHYCFHYDLGFLKRGLVGATLHLVLDTWDYWTLSAVALGVLGLLVALLLALQGRRDLALAGCLLCSSPGFVFLFHTVGYLDHFMLAAVAALTLLRPRLRPAAFWPAYALTFSALMFVHEAAGVIVGPLFGLLIFTGPEAWRRKLALAAGLGVGFLALLLLLRTTGSVSERHARQLRRDVRQHASFQPSEYAFRVLSRDWDTNREFMATYPLRQPLLRCLRSYGPATLLFALAAAWAALCAARPARERWALAGLAVVASGAPLLLNLIGSDTYRWGALTTLTSFLALAMVVRAVGAPWRHSPALLAGVALVLLVNLTAPNHFFDGLSPRTPDRFGEVLQLVTRFGDPEAIPQQ